VSLLVEPGEVTAHTAPPETGTVSAVFIAPALVERAARETGTAAAGPHLTAGAVTDPVLFEAFARLHDLLMGMATRLERQSHLAACLQLLLDRYAERRPPAPPVGREAAAVRRVRDYIHTCYGENLSLDDLAAVAGLGRFQLATAFRREAGLPPHAYHVQVRVAAARRLLATGTSPVRVAAETGFADQSHMIRHFRRALGVTPGEYVRSTNHRPRPWAAAAPSQMAARARRRARMLGVVPPMRRGRSVAAVMLAESEPFGGISERLG
jgi:AraC-like DNA-binding protein